MLWSLEMAESNDWQWIPTSFTLAQVEQFAFPHLFTGRRGPPPKLPLDGIFNYVLRLLHTGRQWQELPIEKDAKGLAEIHYTRIYRMFRYWQARGCIDAIVAGSVLTLHQHGYLDTSALHGDATTTVAKKGGDNIGFSG